MPLKTPIPINAARLKLRNTQTFDNELVAVTQIQDNIMPDLLGRADEYLKRRNIEIADVDPIAGFEMLYRVNAHTRRF